MLTSDEDVPQVYAYVNSSKSVNSNGSGQTRLFVTLGTGPVFTHSTKQVQRDTSSSECELISLDDSYNTIVWYNCFLKCQGYDVKPTIVYHDNNSVIKIIINNNSKNLGGKHHRAMFG